MEIESEPGKGTRVCVYAPARSESQTVVEGEDRERADHDRPDGSRARIDRADAPLRVLLVDDHGMVRQGLAEVLRESGIAVVGQAADGETAVDLARSAEPDVVLMDVSMPGMGGVEATRRIKAARPGVRVIGLSMHEEDYLVRMMLEAGAEQFLTKDGPLENLVRAVRRHEPA